MNVSTAPAQSHKPSKALSAVASMRAANRRILVVGAGGTGKTTFSVSASAHAGDTIPSKELRELPDVAVLQGDNEGVAGAVGANLAPKYIYDLSDTVHWNVYERRLVEALQDLRPLLTSREVRYLVVDLAHPNRLIQESVDPSVQKDWKEVANLGMKFFRAFAGLPGLTIIGNAQIKSAQAIAETMQAGNAAEARAVGGERSTFASDLYKGVGSVWVENASLQLAREVKRKKDPASGAVVPVFSTHTQSNSRFEAKSRFRSVLKPTEDGSTSLHVLLKRAYGDAL